jgi:hypothetical protein
MPATNASRIPSSAASTNATVAKPAGGKLHGVVAYNTTASVIYLKLYNSGVSPTVGTTTVVLTFPIPPNAGIAALVDEFVFSAGISYALTTGAADNDTGAVGAGAVTSLSVIWS